MSTEKSVLMEHMNTVDLNHHLNAGGLVFLPVGTLEPHGRHLPVGTDTICAREVAVELAKRLSGIVAPPLGYGLTNLLAQTPPASFFPEPLFQAFVDAILEGLAQHGFSPLVIVNGHGGNRDALKAVARAFIKRRAVALSVIHWWHFAEPPAKKIYGATGGHAANEETAAMLFFDSQLVRRDQYSPDEDDYTPSDAMWCYPPPGEVLIYHDDPRGRPDFDRAKARSVMEQTIDAIEARLKSWMSRIRRLGGGLRP
ncbi:MAG TPA: creatininase family protein [Candidatus Ozemobacteraceae bacterium]|nr:creatininase family protein [Candidatus Ozemobacteraceae bacterium]